ncbi:putative nucleic acid-binding protein [Proteiniphilum saccharofermentans]|uniref:Putative nucleic acid-binding protein n=1 Tax=Proteiniphilum saccharofermentans TaxID=1642647 RepID=A0A1R3T870_9BACT|nr:putative toxin-antitoxin system toxin component, PIN family [Proteiniphilum saccharofermentans]SCD20787.1 putative nucleic acid-binding protein [Proteiniphilum saccharofermentans]
MQRIVIDTNVIVSALIQKNYPFLIIDELFFEDKIQLCVSSELIQEYFDVLSRPKFARFPHFISKAENILTEIGLKAELFEPDTKLNIISDKDDNMILELAEKCNADFIITGNTNDFTMSEYKSTKIVTPREYWENHKPR